MRFTALSCSFLVINLVIACSLSKQEKMEQTDLLYFSVHTTGGWKLDIYPDGSGHIQYGRSNQDALFLQASSLKYNELHAYIDSANTSVSDSLALAELLLFHPSMELTERRYLQDQEEIHLFFSKVIQQIDKSHAPIYKKRRIKKLFRSTVEQ